MSPPETNLSPSARVLSDAPISNPSSLRLGRVAWVALGVILVAAAVGLVPRWRQRAALRVETAELAVPSVIVTSATPGKAGAGLSLPAEVKPYIEAPIYARANGYLKRWLVDIGAQVEEGALLAEIDTPELNQELARARAELAQADAALALAKITAARWVDLLKTSSVSEQDAAEKQSDLALKTANIQAAQANVRRLEELQSFAKVTAPFAGTITARRTDVGDLISANSGKELFHLAQTHTLRVYVRVPQTAARSITAGQVAEMNVPELPGRRIPAKVVRTSGAMDAASRTLLTELQVDNASGDLLAGSYAEVRFPELKLDAATTLPSNTLLFRAEGTQVGVVRPDGEVELRSVTLGRDFGPTVEVLAGVQPSDRIIVNPSDSLVTGTKVRIGETAEPPPGVAAGQGKQPEQK
jgi:RND family efflux transporter MFP subunit